MKIFVMCTLKTGLDAINHIHNKIKIDGIIGLSKREENEKISGYEFLKKYSKKKQIKFIPIQDYSLKNESDKKDLLSLDIDILLVLGWQRLIPAWLIKHCKSYAIGVHGSPWGIQKGRGRSPQNWALLLGKKEFEISIFKINEHMDSGEIMASDKFKLTDVDDIQTSYFKSNILTAKMIIENIQSKSKTKSKKQESEPRYLPQRMPEDGEIDWNRNSQEIYNFVRAITKPYPGAFSYVNNTKVTFWKVRNFALKLNTNFKPGSIIAIFENKKFLVKTSNGIVLVDNYDIDTNEKKFEIKEGMILKSANFKKQIKRVIERHYKKYPNYKIHDQVINLAN